MKFSLIVFTNVVLATHAFSLPPPRSPPLRYTHASKVIPDRTAMKTSATTLNAPAVTEEENGVDESYPWRFDGRFWFRPSFVRAPPLDELPDGVSCLALFGWTVGGVVALEYDISPVGPYREYVTMGALVAKRGAIGQWGRRLLVNTPAASEVCTRTWGVPAELAAIDFVEQQSGDEDEGADARATLGPFTGLRVVKAPSSGPSGASSSSPSSTTVTSPEPVAPTPFPAPLLALQQGLQQGLDQLLGNNAPSLASVSESFASKSSSSSGGSNNRLSRTFVAPKEGQEDIQVVNWARTRSSAKSSSSSSRRGGDAANVDIANEPPTRFGGVPVFWTPSIKALWAPVVPLPAPSSSNAPAPLPLHQLRLSATSVRLHWCSQAAGEAGLEALGLPFPVGLSADGLRIEIGRERSEGL